MFTIFCLLVYEDGVIPGAAFASKIAYIVTTLVVIGAFTKISQKSWSEILIIKKTDFQDYKNILYKIRKRILKSDSSI